jgi:hypothetical protein
MKVWILMIFFLSAILGCHAVEGLQEVKEKANNEGKRILENIDGYVQKVEIGARRVERACFSYFKSRFQKGIINQRDRGTGAQMQQEDNGVERK